jgi:ATP-dependent Lon protease
MAEQNELAGVDGELSPGRPLNQSQPARMEEGSDSPPPPGSAGAETESEGGIPGVSDPAEVPDELPVLPLRNIVVFPLSFLPLSVGQPRSRRLVEEAAVGDRLVALVASKDPEVVEPGPDEIHSVGTVAYIHRMVKGSDGNIGLFVQGLDRIRIDEWIAEEPYLRARITVLHDEHEDNLEIEALTRKVVELFTRLVNLVPHLPEELIAAVGGMDDARALSYFVAANTRMEPSDAQAFLETETVEARLRSLLLMLTRELEVLEIGKKIQQEARGEMEKLQREYFLRQQLKAIQRELGEDDGGGAEMDELEKRIRDAGMAAEAETEALRELSRLRSIPEASAEHGVIRTYLDWLVSLPWSNLTDDNLDIGHARKVLDDDHYGLEDIKTRIIEFLAVQKLRRERFAEADDIEDDDAASDDENSPRLRVADGDEVSGGIMAFVGPPGTGKTSLGRSIARTLGREFVRMSLGGLRDEAEIRGHRRTYIGAMPGRIIQGLKRAGTRNPVFMLDEIDKVGASFRGDPESALLEVLDPEQNREFRDLYLDVPFDLSDVLFIATANVLDTISAPLRDRMEIIELSGYTESDKVHIARGYLIPRQATRQGLRTGELDITDDALREIIRGYTREAGVRTLERQIGRLARKAAVRIAGGDETRVVVDAAESRASLGPPKFTFDAAERTDIPGVATGLAYTPFGGDVLFIEASVARGSGKFAITGQVGDVMRESAQAALSYVRASADRLGVPPEMFGDHDIHVHVPAGATPKDGPSAGVAIATALASLLTRRPVRSDVGMTGEITLRGKVLPIGGLKEKALAAHRAGLKTVIMPERNQADLEAVPEEVRNDLEFVLVDRVSDVWRNALVGGLPESKLDGLETFGGEVEASRSVADQQPSETSVTE